MQIGSIVECINGSLDNDHCKKLVEKHNYKFPTEKEAYTVIGICVCNGFLLDEIRNPEVKIEGMTKKHEIGFRKNRFRELLPPMSDELTELLKQPETELV